MRFLRGLALLLALVWGAPAWSLALPSEPADFTLESAISRAMAQHPAIQSARARVAQARLEKGRQDLWWARLFSANANYIVANPAVGYNAATAAGTSPYAAVGLGFNLGDLLSGPRNVSSAEEALNMAEAELRRTALEVASQVSTTFQEYQAAKEAAALSMESITAAEADKLVVERQFSQGLAALNALSGARLAVRRAQQESSQSGGNVARAWSHLLSAMGESAWLESALKGQER